MRAHDSGAAATGATPIATISEIKVQAEAVPRLVRVDELSERGTAVVILEAGSQRWQPLQAAPLPADLQRDVRRVILDAEQVHVERGIRLPLAAGGAGMAPFNADRVAIGRRVRDVRVEAERVAELAVES